MKAMVFFGFMAVLLCGCGDKAGKVPTPTASDPKWWLNGSTTTDTYNNLTDAPTPLGAP